MYGKGRTAGRVGSGQTLSAIAGRVGSGQHFAGSGRVGSGPRKVTRGQLCWLNVVESVTYLGFHKGGQIFADH